jgi:hypothetical protein
MSRVFANSCEKKVSVDEDPFAASGIGPGDDVAPAGGVVHEKNGGSMGALAALKDQDTWAGITPH